MNRTVWLVVAGVVLVIVGALTWRYHEHHLPTPKYPSSWVEGNASSYDVAYISWTRDGTQIFGTFDETGTEFENSITNKMDCLHGSVGGNLNGHSINYGVAWSDGSGTSHFYGQISQTSFSVGGAPGAVATDTFVPGSFSEYEQYLADHNYPNCT